MLSTFDLLICRGLGRQASLMWFNIIGFWAVGFTTGYTLAFKVKLGLTGIWWGIFSGVSTTGQQNTKKYSDETKWFAQQASAEADSNIAVLCCAVLGWGGVGCDEV